jgi:hypothetical protein
MTGLQALACNPSGVTFDADGTVLKVDLNSSGLTGTLSGIPWQNMTSLEHLDLSNQRRWIGPEGEEDSDDEDDDNWEYTLTGNAMPC